MPPRSTVQSGPVDSWGRRNDRILADKVCQRCGESFKPKEAVDKYCSRACGYANNGAKGLTIEELFNLIDCLPIDDNGCKILNRSNRSDGYPLFTVKEKHFRVSRLVLERKLNREIISGMFALHTCDNTRCVNEDHIYEGTQKQNIADARERDRLATGDRHGLRKHPDRIARGDRSSARLYPDRVGFKRFYEEHPGAFRGENSGAAKLTENNVREIRLATGFLREIAEKYGVGISTIRRIRSRESWRHVL